MVRERTKRSFQWGLWVSAFVAAIIGFGGLFYANTVAYTDLWDLFVFMWVVLSLAAAYYSYPGRF